MRYRRSLLALLALASLASLAVASKDPIVYATEAGKKYHVKTCRLKHGSHGMKLSEAKKAGYTPCKVCKPPK